MFRIALLVLVLAGCDNTKPEERKLQDSPGRGAPGATAPGAGTPAPGATAPGTAPGAPGGGATPGAPGAGAPAGTPPTASEPAPAKGTGFAPFDDAAAGKQPWIAPDDKDGIVELVAIDDKADGSKNKFSVDRRCGAEALRVVETIGKRMLERAKAGAEAPRCKELDGKTSCFQAGAGEPGLELEYGKAGGGWRVIGAKTYAMGVGMDKEEARYAALLKEKCK